MGKELQKLLIITGMSGAGKSRTVNALEDIGWFCVDNLPPRLAVTFMQLLRGQDSISRTAIVVDVRAGDAFEELSEVLEALRREGVAFELLFLDAGDEVLQRRFKETRRQHPLSLQLPFFGLFEVIVAERKLLEPYRSRADILIDTSWMTPADCKNRIIQLFSDEAQQGFRTQITSFGFKNGTPRDCDLLFDVRCLPNPFYIEDLKQKSGRDRPVQDYIFSFSESKLLLEKLCDLLLFLLPLYQKEGKTSLSVGIGCTGGRHRSVLFAEEIGRIMAEKGFFLHINHRDL